MNDKDEDRIIEEQFGDVLPLLGQLRSAIESQRCPGKPWTVPPRRRRRIAYPLIATAAVAALLIAGVSLSWVILQDGAPRAPTEVEEPFVWYIPSDIDPSIVGSVGFEIPRVSIPDVDRTAGLEWNIPTISFPFVQERSNNHEL